MDDTGATTRDVCIHMLDQLLDENKRHAKSVRLLGKLSPGCGMTNEEVFKLTELLGDHYRRIWRFLSNWQYELQHRGE